MAAKRFKVYIECNTYNQSAYIEDTLNGFVLQETNFPYVAVVADDASTDGEQKVLLDYLAANFDKCNLTTEYEHENEEVVIHFARHKVNRNCYFAVVLLKYNHYSKQLSRQHIYDIWQQNCEYVALCEGDDYWIDSMKLQKQVDFLDGNSEYGMCHTDFVLADSGRRKHYVEKYSDGNYFPFIITNNDIAIGTLTVVFRYSTFMSTPKSYRSQRFVAGDYPLWIELSKISKIKYLRERTSAYRVHSGSASHSSNIKKAIQFREGMMTIRKFYAELYGLKITDYKSYYTNLLRTCYILEDADMAVQKGYEAYKSNNLTIRGIVFYIGAKYNWIHRLIDMFYRSPR